MMTEQKDFIMPTTIVDDDFDEDDLGDADIMKESVTSNNKRGVKKYNLEKFVKGNCLNLSYN